VTYAVARLPVGHFHHGDTSTLAIVNQPVPFDYLDKRHSISLEALHELAAPNQPFNRLRPIDVDYVLERYRPLLERLVREKTKREGCAVVHIINGDIPPL
jgi:hypothetical protein